MPIPKTPPDQMSFWEHLHELRSRIFRVLIAIIVCFGFTYTFRFTIWDWVQRPLLMSGQWQTASGDKPWAFTNLTEPFFSLMRLSLWSAAIIALPIVFYQIWAFIKPGLKESERRYMVPFVASTTAFFLLGVGLAYSYGFELLSNVLWAEATLAGLRANLHMADYLDFFLGTLFLSGLIFELPILFFILARLRIVSPQAMFRYWRQAVIAILVISSLGTPGDVIITTLFFALLLLGLYFFSIFAAWLAYPRTPKDPSEVTL